MASLDNFPIAWTSGSAVVTLPAEIDIDNAEQLRDTLLAVLNRGVRLLVIDMTGTAFCDCSGVGAVARAYLRAQADGGRVRLVTRTPIVRRLLALTGVDHIVPVCDTLADALAADADRSQVGPGARPLAVDRAWRPDEDDPYAPQLR